MLISLPKPIRNWFYRHPNARRYVCRLSSLASGATTFTGHLLARFPVLFAIAVVIATLIIVPIATSPIIWLPKVGEGEVILGTLLTAQAAIAALTLAVSLFMMQGINARRDADDRMYREYVRRSWVRYILWGSLLFVGVTGIVLFSEQVFSQAGIVARAAPGLRNLLLIAGVAFLINLLLPGVLFQKALRLSRPGQWRSMRHDLNKRDVQGAVKALLARHQRILASRDDSAELSFLFPGTEEGSADEAIQALLDDARRAMSERRQADFKQSLDSIIELIKYAMQQIEKNNIQWSPPGSQAAWPPLRELARSLYSFREDVIREGDRDYIFNLLSFDYRLIALGRDTRCGELFTVGLFGYRWNYQIANRIGGGEFREYLRDRFSLNANAFITGLEPVQALTFVKEMIRLQEYLLSDALHIDRANDFDQLHKGFQARLEMMLLDWEGGGRHSSEFSKPHKQLEQEYRIVLMGLGGRAISLAETSRIKDADPYLNVGRRACAKVRQMADDLAVALLYDSQPGLSLWEEWEMEGAEAYQTIGISSEQYPLLFFAVQCLERTSDSPPAFNLHGRAEHVLRWFMDNVERVKAYVRLEPDQTWEKRRELVEEALRLAVRRDEIAEDYDIIERELSQPRVSAFISDVYAGAFSVNSVERLFQLVDRSLYVPTGSDDSPKERGFRQLVAKAYLTETPEGGLIEYAPLGGSQWGSGLANDLLLRFCQALEAAPQTTASLDTPSSFFHAIDHAIDDLNALGPIGIVLAGNWTDLTLSLPMQNPEGYEEDWQAPENNQIGEFARYRGHPIIRFPTYNNQRLFVVDPAAWGCLVRAQN